MIILQGFVYIGRLPKSNSLTPIFLPCGERMAVANGFRMALQGHLLEPSMAAENLAGVAGTTRLSHSPSSYTEVCGAKARTR